MRKRLPWVPRPSAFPLTNPNPSSLDKNALPVTPSPRATLCGVEVTNSCRELLEERFKFDRDFDAGVTY
jgi:hypothetical protein